VQPTSIRYRADVDGLRAVAVLAVIAYHAFPDLAPGGFVGVDVFFVISGFLITGILVSALESGSFSLREFYSRRVRRIFPALSVTLAACWGFGWFALFQDEYRQLGRHVAYGAGFLANVAFWREAGYFDNAAETKPLLHLWSLGIEEQFYIVWPLLLALAWRRRVVGAGLSVVALASFALNLAAVGRDPTAAFYSPASRAWELALGGVVAVVARRGVDGARRESRWAALRRLGRRHWAPPAREAGAAVGLALIGVAVMVVDRAAAFPGWWALLPTLGTALLLLGRGETRIHRWLLANRPMVGIGLVSYPLYLWHWPLLSFPRVVEAQVPPLAVRLLAIAVAFGLAVATWRWIERPFRRGSAARWKVVTLVTAMTVAGVAGRVTASNHGLPMRAAVQHSLSQQRALLLPDEADQAAACKRRFGFDEEWEFCLLDRPDLEPTVALVGDSHAHHLVAGLSRYYRERGDNLLYLGTRLPFWGVSSRDDDRYQEVTPAMLDLALASRLVHTVILCTALKMDLQKRIGREHVRLATATLERFLAAGKRVIWVEDVPELDFEPRQCLRRVAIPTSTTRIPCAIDRRAFDRDTAPHRSALATLRARLPELRVFEAWSVLCDDARCWALRDGKLLYRDKDHLSVDGDLLVGEAFGRAQATERRSDSGP
jgi:peptidoglycan/LPS O-acetylase OafA/YrhL